MEKEEQMDTGASTEMREKYWCELTTDEKVERTRLEVKRMERQMKNAYAVAYEAKELARSHMHAPDGRPMIPARNSMTQSNGDCCDFVRRPSDDDEREGKVSF